MKALKVLFVAALAVGLSACGGAKLGGGKEGASKALFEATQPASSAQGSWVKTYGAFAGETTGEVTVQGKSGSATVTFEASDNTDPNNFAFTMTVSYDGYSDDDETFFNGSMKITMSIKSSTVGTTTTASIDFAMKGRMEMSGKISDFVEADVVMSMSASASESSAGTVSVKMNGTVSTSEDSYTFNNEEISFDAGAEISAEGEAGTEDGA